MFALINTRFWAIEADFYARVKPYVLKSLREGTPLMSVIPDVLKGQQKEMSIQAVSYEAADNASGTPRKNGTSYNIAIIPLAGVMQKNGGMCSLGTKDVRDMIANANQDPNISAIVLVVDSPGGAVDGTEDLGNDIATSAKPIVGFVDGLAASAGYWAISQTKEIVMNTETTSWVGSIGVLCTHIDQTAFLEKEGMKVTVIRADQSTDKAQFNSLEPLTEDVIATQKKDLNTIADTFISIVKAGRGDRLKAEDVFSGKVFNGKDAIKKGLVDSIGSLQDAVNLAAKYADKQQKTQNSKSTQSNSIMKVKGDVSPLVAKVLGLTAIDEETEITAESLVKLEAALKTAEEAKTVAETAKAGLEANIQKLEGTIETMKASATEKDNQIKTLEDWKKESAVKDTRKTDATSQGPEAELPAYQKEANDRAKKAKANKEASAKLDV